MQLLTRMGLAFTLLLPTVALAQNESVYSSLKTSDCQTTEFSDEGAGSYLGKCQGVAGFALEIEEGDIRQTINVISPSGKIFELDFARVSGAFSSVGEKAEWRMNKGIPVALIVRFSFSQSAEKPEVTTSYLIVSKISKTEACITDVVKPSKDQNAQARKLADEAAQKTCKTFLN